jgi:hypothetical protein
MSSPATSYPLQRRQALLHPPPVTRHSLLLLSSLPMSSPVTSYPPLFTRHSASGARSDSRKKIDAKITSIIDFAEDSFNPAHPESPSTS